MKKLLFLATLVLPLCCFAQSTNDHCQDSTLQKQNAPIWVQSNGKTALAASSASNPQMTVCSFTLVIPSGATVMLFDANQVSSPCDTFLNARTGPMPGPFVIPFTGSVRLEIGADGFSEFCASVSGLGSTPITGIMTYVNTASGS